MRRLILAFLILAAGCTSTGQSTGTPTDTSTPAPTDSTNLERETSRGTLAEDPAHRALGRWRSGLAFFDGRQYDQFYADGTTLTLSFPGTTGDIESNQCFSQYEFVVDESADQVGVTIYRLEPAVPAPRERGELGDSCALAMTFGLLEAELEQPLNGRPLVWTPTGEELPVSDVAQLREPADSTNGWTLVPKEAQVEILGRRYGPVVVETSSPHTRSYDRIVGLQQNPNHQMVTIVEGVEGVLNQRTNGSQRLGIVWDNWFYDIIADPGTDTAQLLAFAASFQTTNGS